MSNLEKLVTEMASISQFSPYFRIGSFDSILNKLNLFLPTVRKEYVRNLFLLQYPYQFIFGTLMQKQQIFALEIGTYSDYLKDCIRSNNVINTGSITTENFNNTEEFASTYIYGTGNDAKYVGYCDATVANATDDQSLINQDTFSDKYRQYETSVYAAYNKEYAREKLSETSGWVSLIDKLNLPKQNTEASMDALNLIMAYIRLKYLTSVISTHYNSERIPDNYKTYILTKLETLQSIFSRSSSLTESEKTDIAKYETTISNILQDWGDTEPDEEFDYDQFTETLSTY